MKRLLYYSISNYNINYIYYLYSLSLLDYRYLIKNILAIIHVTVRIVILVSNIYMNSTYFGLDTICVLVSFDDDVAVFVTVAVFVVVTLPSSFVSTTVEDSVCDSE